MRTDYSRFLIQVHKTNVYALVIQVQYTWYQDLYHLGCGTQPLLFSCGTQLYYRALLCIKIAQLSCLVKREIFSLPRLKKISSRWLHYGCMQPYNREIQSFVSIMQVLYTCNINIFAGYSHLLQANDGITILLLQPWPWLYSTRMVHVIRLCLIFRHIREHSSLEPLSSSAR